MSIAVGVKSAQVRVSDLRARPLTILHVAAPTMVGGLEQVIHALATGHTAAGHSVYVAAILDANERDHPFVRDLAAAGVRVHAPSLRARAYRRERAFIAELCRELNPSIVHTHGYRPDVVDGPVSMRLGIPTVSTVHGFTRARGRGLVYEWLQRRALRGFDAVVAVSRPQMTELTESGVPQNRLHFVPNAWSPRVPALARSQARAALKIADTTFHVGWVGRLSWEKGPDVLLAALSELSDLPIVISFIGQGPEQKRLQEQAARNGLAAKVRFHGLIPAASQYFSAFDAFALSSRTEGTPIALFEAMTAGAPIVTTAVGGVPDVVTSSEAMLVRSEDPQALASALRDVYDDRVAASARAQCARVRMQEYSPGPWLKRYEALYSQLSTHSTPETDHR